MQRAPELPASSQWQHLLAASDSKRVAALTVGLPKGQHICMRHQTKCKGGLLSQLHLEGSPVHF